MAPFSGSSVPMLAGCHTAKALARARVKIEERLLAPAHLTSPSLFSRSPKPHWHPLCVTGLERKDRRSPQLCLFTSCLFPRRWAHILTRVTSRVQETLLQLLVSTESGPWRESSKSWLWFACSGGFFFCKGLKHAWDLALKIRAPLLIIFIQLLWMIA